MARILLIEDNRDHLELMAYLLRAQGHMPLSAGSAESGRTMMHCCHEIDLIICDIKLGNESGIDLVRSLRKSGRFADVPIVAITAGATGQAPEAFAAGFNHYFLKPIEPETFMAEVNRWLAGGRKPGAPPPLPIPGPPPVFERLPKGERATILAVDDKSANLDLISALLQPVGYRIITARGVAEALARIRCDRPNLVLTDVHMGDGTGFNLIREIQQDASLRHIPWLVTSATYLTMDCRAREFQLDDSNFILQPWEPHALVAKIRTRLQLNRSVPKQKGQGSSG